MNCTIQSDQVLGDNDASSANFQCTKYTLSDSAFSISIHDSIRSIEAPWSATAPNNTFYSIEFLSLIEDHPPVGVKAHYLMVWDQEVPVGIIYLQEKNFKLSESLNLKRSSKASSFNNLGYWLKSQLTKLIRSKMIVCGNVLLTGEYGYYFKPESVQHPDSMLLVEESICLFLKTQFGWRNRFVPILMKDFYADKSIKNLGVKTQFTEFYVQPNMIMNLDPNWANMEDYLAAMKSKHRTRAKSAFKKLANVEKRLLSREEISKYNDLMYDLYLQTANDAGFNLFYLPKDYFIQIKAYLNEKIDMYGYFLDGKMISYYTLVHGEKYMEAHYIGFDKQLNHPMKIYLNMLFDIVKAGIESEAPKIQFARTALEIKSSVGAVGHEMQCLVKHTFLPINMLAGTILDYFVPEEQWKPRSPFK